MNATKQFLRIACLGTIVLAISIPGWSKTFHLSSTPMVPGALGTVNADRDKNGNLHVMVRVDHLAKPEILTPPANTYVVWFKEPGADPQSQGEMRIDDSEKGVLRTSTPAHNFDVFITAESDGQTKVPSDRVALRTTVQNPK